MRALLATDLSVHQQNFCHAVHHTHNGPMALLVYAGKTVSFSQFTAVLIINATVSSHRA